MTISNTPRKAGPYAGNGSATTFAFAFKVFSAADVLVVRAVTATGIETTLALNTDYTVSLNADQDTSPGGTITTTTAPATGQTITLSSDMDYTQPVELTNNGGFYPRVINDALDRLTIGLQQLKELTDRTLKVAVSTPPGVDTTLPAPEANKLIGWNPNADNLQNIDLATMATIVAFGTANADIFSGDGVTTQFALSANPGALNNLDVSINGVTQTPGDDYMWTSGTTITFTSAPPAGTGNVLVRYMQGLPQGYTDSNASLYNPAGAGAVATTVQNKLRESVSVKDFVCSDGLPVQGNGVHDDTTGIQAALNSGASQVYFPDGTYRITNSLVMNQALQQAVLAAGCTVSLDTATTTLKAFDVQADSAVVRGGRITTTLRTLNFLVRLAGANSKLQDSVLFFATKSTIAPIGGTDIPYNRGGVELRGDGAEVSGCEIYNQEGAGVVTYADCMTVQNCKIHDNVLGIHATINAGETTERTVSILGNKIYDNNVNHAEGADGILTSVYVNAIITENEISGSGEHGMYVYSRRSTITGNRCFSNYRVGLKIKSLYNTVVSANVCQNNNTQGAGTNGEMELQVQSANVSDIVFANNIAHGANSTGIKIAYLDAGLTCQRVSFVGNIADNMRIAFSSDVMVADNIVSGTLAVGDAQASAPATQSKALIKGNRAATLTMGRCVDSTFEGNEVATLTGGTVAPARNRIIGNRMTAQETQIIRSCFDIFSDNVVDCTGLATTLLLQAANSAANSFKQITGNRFISHAARVIDDSSSAISGTKNVISGNVFDSATQGISMWGDGHTIMNNANVSTGGVGFVGCNNSWLIGNSPIIALRAGTTGNVVS